jgi:hypothetical protein
VPQPFVGKPSPVSAGQEEGPRFFALATNDLAAWER